jgi:hypothetical protein
MIGQAAMEASMKFIRRLGDETNTSNRDHCPGIWELDDGSFAVIGTDVTEQSAGKLPADVHVAHFERLVVIPRPLLVSSRKDIPES